MLSACRLHQCAAEAGTTVYALSTTDFPRIYKWTYEHDPNPKQLRSLCMRLGCSADYLLGRSMERLPTGKPEKSMPLPADALDGIRSREFNISKRLYNTMRRINKSGRIQIGTLCRLADEYGVTVDYLLGIGD